MKWSLSYLLKNANQPFTFEESLVFDQELIAMNKNLIDIKDIVVSGIGKYQDAVEILTLNLQIHGLMIVKCSLSCMPVEYPFTSIEELKFTFNPKEEDDEIHKIKGNTVNIVPYVWQLITMEVPLRVVSKEINIPKSGPGWQLVDEDEINKGSEQSIDPRLAKLKEFYDKQQ